MTTKNNELNTSTSTFTKMGIKFEKENFLNVKKKK
jgi:hypothetical protein